MIDSQMFLTAKEVADLLRLKPITLAIWRSSGRGPKYFKIGGSIRYSGADIELWANADEASRMELERSYDCHQDRQRLVKRPRGRVGADQRARRLKAEPLCRDCLAEGMTRPSEEIDHIVPLSQGGSDEENNIRCLCKGCHAYRTRRTFWG